MLGAIIGIWASNHLTPATLLPFTMNNAPAFVNPNITSLSFTANNAPGLANQNITILPFTAGK